MSVEATDADLHSDICEQYLTICEINLTPVAAYLRETTSVRTLLLLLLLIGLLYAACISAYACQMLMIFKGNNTRTFAENEYIHKALSNMRDDNYNCHYCIKSHTSHDIIEKTLELHNDHMQQQKHLSRLRIILNVFSVYNVLLVFVVYGEPKIINTLTSINAFLIIIVQFIEQFYVIMFIESSVVLVATVIALQSNYCLIVASYEVYARQLKKAKKI